MNARSLVERIWSALKWRLFVKWSRLFIDLRNRRRAMYRAYPVVRGLKRGLGESRRALLDYVVDPFLPLPDGNMKSWHSNWRESQLIASILLDMGYTVDVTDWRNMRAPSAREYDLVLGVHEAYSVSCARRPREAMKIYLGTGAYAGQAIAAEEERLEGLERRRGTRLRRRYRTTMDRGPHLSDAVFAMGDDWVCETYRKAVNVPVFQYPNIITGGVKDSLAGKDFTRATRRFLWQASFAAVHRGLDILLDVFRATPECELWVCGGIECEHDFVSLYRKELRETNNIHFLGWMDVSGRDFCMMASQCAYIIYPSASDAMPGSVINCMAAGLIPIVTKESGVDTGGLGRLIASVDLDVVRALVIEASEADARDVEERAHQV